MAATLVFSRPVLATTVTIEDNSGLFNYKGSGKYDIGTKTTIQATPIAEIPEAAQEVITQWNNWWQKNSDGTYTRLAPGKKYTATAAEDVTYSTGFIPG